jgi:Putative DNA-binding domain
MAEPALPALQRWLQDCILAGGSGAAAHVAGDGRLSAAERVGIYAQAYRARLLDTLRDEFPALRLLVGDTVFDLFAEGFLAASPSCHFSLYELGGGFAGYLAESRPRDGDPMLALPEHLARLERARAEVHRARGPEAGPDAPIAADAALLPGTRLRLPDSVRLLRLGWDFRPLIAAAESGGDALVPESGPSPTAVARSRYRVAVHALEPGRFAFLEALGADGAEVHAAAARAARALSRPAGALIADLALWLPAAGAAGLVVPA